MVFPGKALADVLINEIYPNPAVGENEWIELINTSSDQVNLTGWYLEDKSQAKMMLDSLGSISGGGIKYLEGEKDGWFLNNTEETVYLKDSAGTTKDEYSYSGTKESKSFARVPDAGSWTENNQPTKGSSNAQSTPTPSPSSTSTSSPSPASTTTPTPSPTPRQTNDYGNISLTEIYPAPETGSNEWVEIYNGNDHEANLNGWYIQDNAGTYKEIRDFSIGGKSYAYYAFGSGYLNNSGDTVSLLNSEKQSKSSLPAAYPGLNASQSWSKVGDDWCRTAPSKGEANKSCSDEIVAASPTVKVSPTSTPRSTAMTLKQKDSTVGAEPKRQLPVLGAKEVRQDSSTVSAVRSHIIPPKLLLPLGIAGSGLMILGGSLTALTRPDLISGIIRAIVHR